jgi:hypothetical protein
MAPTEDGSRRARGVDHDADAFRRAGASGRRVAPGRLPPALDKHRGQLLVERQEPIARRGTGRRGITAERGGEPRARGVEGEIPAGVDRLRAGARGRRRVAGRAGFGLHGPHRHGCRQQRRQQNTVPRTARDPLAHPESPAVHALPGGLPETLAKCPGG